MKFSKRSLSMMVAIILCAAMTIGGTFAYLTDTTDEVANVMTVGSVHIAQTETFDETTANLLPGVKITKEIFVENTGKSDAYVRTLVSFEMGTMSEADFVKYVKWSYNETDWTQGTPYTEDGKYVVPFTYNSILKPGQKTPASLTKVWLDETAGNAQVEQLANADGKYTVYALSQAVQTEGFNTAEEALAAAFDGSSPKQGRVVTAAELQAMLNTYTQSNGNATISIAEDLTLAEGQNWNSSYVYGYTGTGIITIEGNGHTIKGLNAPLFEGGFAGNSGIVINNLTIADSKIQGTEHAEDYGSGAFIEYVDAMATVTLTNCHLKNSSVTGSRTGGLIGWTAGYDVQEDGPVDTRVTISGCSVEDCTINGGANSVGAIIAHAGSNPATYTTIENCTVKNNNLKGGSDKTGVILGTANVGEVTITSCAMSDNKINDEPSDHVYGRFVPGGTGKLTINGTDVY